MRRTVMTAMLLALCATLVSRDQRLVNVPLAAQGIRGVPRISIDEVKALMAKKQVLVIDVRDPQSYINGHIPGARHIVMADVLNYVEELQKEKRMIVTYCA
jgi:3-mercaptopyruvate sulfurtransferase SseA